MNPQPPAPQAKTFGLVAGLGVGAGIFYYKAIVQAHLARGFTPNLLMVHADVRRVMSLANARAVQPLAEYLAGLIGQLALGGARIASIPAFSPRVCQAELSALTPIPLISLTDAIAHEVKRRQLRRVALFGARVTMETRMFGTLDGFTDVATPADEELDTIATTYVRIVEQGFASDRDIDRLRSLAHILVKRGTLDAIVLAGTDLVAAFNPENTDFPHLDGARVHVDAIMRELLPQEGESTPPGIAS
jgi:aspartate racemase